MTSVSFLVILSLFFANVHANSSRFENSPPNTLKAFGIPYENWNCGYNEGLRRWTAYQVNKSCPAIGVDFSHCCAILDDCYTHQRGKDECDNGFCDCMENIKRSHRDLGECEDSNMRTCGLFRSFGMLKYNSSSNDEIFQSPLPTSQHRLPNIEKIAANYSKLYEECPHQIKTLASCALNYDNCVERAPRNCELGLLKCVEDTRLDRDDSAQCDKAVDTVILQMLNPVKVDVTMNVLNAKVQIVTVFRKVWLTMVRPTIPLFVYILAAVFLILICILCLVVCIRCASNIAEYEPTTVIPVESIRVSTASQSSSKTY